MADVASDPQPPASAAPAAGADTCAVGSLKRPAEDEPAPAAVDAVGSAGGNGHEQHKAKSARLDGGSSAASAASTPSEAPKPVSFAALASKTQAAGGGGGGFGSSGKSGSAFGGAGVTATSSFSAFSSTAPASGSIFGKSGNGSSAKPGGSTYSAFANAGAGLGGNKPATTTGKPSLLPGFGSKATSPVTASGGESSAATAAATTAGKLPGFGSSGSSSGFAKGMGGGFGKKPQTASDTSAASGFGQKASGFGSFAGNSAAITAAFGASKNGSAPLLASAGKTAAQKALDEEKPKFVGGPQDTGEEAESHAVEVARCKLYRFVPGEGGKGSWQERCNNGQLTLNINKDDASSARLVLRHSTTKRLVLNAPVWKGLNPHRISPKNLRITAINHADKDVGDNNTANNSHLQTFLLKMASANLELLEKALKERIDALPQTAPAPAPEVAAASSTPADPDSSPAKTTASTDAAEAPGMESTL